jgi:N-acetylneuraminate synthase
VFSIDGRPIGRSVKPYIVAELSANHGGSIERAKATILAAKSAGADAVKLQTYTPDTMTIECDRDDFLIKDGLWEGYGLYELYKTAFTPFEWHEELFDFAKQNSISIFSTPFDESALELLESLDAPAYKIASFELTDLPLIRAVAATGKPMLVSTGMGRLEEIAEAVAAIRATGNDRILLFHCISSYPAPTEQSNLNNILTLRNEFNLEVGLSDHTISNIAAVTSIGIGAVALEKHFKPDDLEDGPDSSFSLTPAQLESLVNDCTAAWKALGSASFERSEAEAGNVKFRRSLYFVTTLKKGDTVTEADIRRIRPGYGLPPKFYDDVVGRVLSRDVERGDRVVWEAFE